MLGWEEREDGMAVQTNQYVITSGREIVLLDATMGIPSVSIGMRSVNTVALFKGCMSENAARQKPRN